MNVGKAEVELLKTAQEGSSNTDSLAWFMIGGLHVSCRMTYGGEGAICKSLHFMVFAGLVHVQSTKNADLHAGI